MTIPVDVTMLVWPGWRGMLAQRRWAIRYGAEDLERFVEMAKARHLAWTERECVLSLAKSLRDPSDVAHTYVDATCKQHELHVDGAGKCPRC